MLYNEKKFTTAAVKAAKNSISELIGAAAEFTTAFTVMQDAACNDGCPLDGQILQECGQMFSAIQRLLYQEEARLKYLQHQQIIEEKAQTSIREFRSQAKSRRQNSVVFVDVI